jgi:hypothetical protein
MRRAKVLNCGTTSVSRCSRRATMDCCDAGRLSAPAGRKPVMDVAARSTAGFGRWVFVREPAKSLRDSGRAAQSFTEAGGEKGCRIGFVALAAWPQSTAKANVAMRNRVERSGVVMESFPGANSAANLMLITCRLEKRRCVGKNIFEGRPRCQSVRRDGDCSVRADGVTAIAAP